MDLRPYICKQCGGAINVQKMRCEYCGTAYRDESLRRVEFVMSKPGEARIRSEVLVPTEMIRNAPEHARDYASSKLREQIADGLLAYMKIETRYDYRDNVEIIRGTVRVVEPEFGMY